MHKTEVSADIPRATCNSYLRPPFVSDGSLELSPIYDTELQSVEDDLALDCFAPQGGRWWPVPGKENKSANVECSACPMGFVEGSKGGLECRPVPFFPEQGDPQQECQACQFSVRDFTVSGPCAACIGEPVKSQSGRCVCDW